MCSQFRWLHLSANEKLILIPFSCSEDCDTLLTEFFLKSSKVGNATGCLAPDGSLLDIEAVNEVGEVLNGSLTRLFINGSNDDLPWLSE
jgi:hypothetical protein